jgi:hypothetical protein
MINHFKLNSSRLFSFALLAMIPFTFCADTFGQTRNVRPKSAHVKRTAEKTLPPEDVYFNADSREVSPVTSLAANQMSATSIGRVLTLMFDSARVSLQSQSDPMVATWSGTITVPTNPASKPKPKSYIQDIRASVNKTADTRVTILLDLGGKRFLVEFPYGAAQQGDLRRRFISLAKSSRAERYTASIFIFAERRNPKGAVLVDIDSIDIDAR